MQPNLFSQWGNESHEENLKPFVELQTLFNRSVERFMRKNIETLNQYFRDNMDQLQALQKSSGSLEELLNAQRDYMAQTTHKMMSLTQNSIEDFMSTSSEYQKWLQAATTQEKKATTNQVTTPASTQKKAAASSTKKAKAATPAAKGTKANTTSA